MIVVAAAATIIACLLLARPPVRLAAGGATFTTVDASSALTTNPGYGWFVDANNWYVTGFTAPSGGGSTTTGTGSTSTGSGSGGSTSAQAAVTRRRRIGNKVALVSTQGAGAKYEFSPVATHGRALQTPTGSYSGQIIKTTNGGSSVSRHMRARRRMPDALCGGRLSSPIAYPCLPGACCLLGAAL